MRTLRDFVDKDLVWVGEGVFRPRHHLKADGEVLGHLRWERAFGSIARAEAADGRWQFQRAGYFPSRFGVRLAETGVEFARLEVAFAATRGVLMFAGVPRCYIWDGKTWGKGWQWTTLEGVPLVRLTTIGHASPASTRFLPEAMNSPDLSLLVLLQWYVILELGILTPYGGGG